MNRAKALMWLVWISVISMALTSGAMLMILSAGIPYDLHSAILYSVWAIITPLLLVDVWFRAVDLTYFYRELRHQETDTEQ